MILNIIDWLNEIIDPFRSWLIANSSNPVLWIGFVVAVILIFSFTYNALNRDK